MPTEIIHNVKSSELRPGDIVLCHGMRCLIDRPINRRDHECRYGPDDYATFYTNALVLNRDEVPHESVPYSFTSTTSYPSRGLPAEPEGTHRWGIQGNDNARHTVERTTSA